MHTMIFSPLEGAQFRKTQGFGDRPSVYKPYKGHLGIDLAGVKPGMKNVKVFSPHEGWSIRGYDEGGFGNYIKIVSDPVGPERARRVSYLAHLNEFLSPMGTTFISAREPVGIMGMTGWADGIHVHWEYFITDIVGKILNAKNGYNGRIDIAPYASLWYGGSLQKPVPAPKLSKITMAAKKEKPKCHGLSSLQTDSFISLPSS